MPCVPFAGKGVGLFMLPPVVTPAAVSCQCLGRDVSAVCSMCVVCSRSWCYIIPGDRAAAK